MKFLSNFLKKKQTKQPIIHTLTKSQIMFMDIENIVHCGGILKYFDPETILCPMIEWISDGIEEDNYIVDYDTNETYPLSQIKKYWLNTLKTIDVYPMKNEISSWKMWYSNDEAEKRKVETNE